METDLEAPIDWIAAHCALDTTDLPRPEVVETGPQVISRELYPKAPRMLPADGAASAVAGAGELPGPRDNPLWRETPLHALVHHVQRQSGLAATWPCPNAGEREAYLQGGTYLSFTGTDDPMPNRRFLAHLHARCRTDPANREGRLP